MADIFTFIQHAGGRADDSAYELFTAAKTIAPEKPATAIVAGNGPELEAVCDEIAAVYPSVWKIQNDALAEANSEVIRNILVALIPKGSIVLLAHDHFGMDLSPGLSIKLDAAYLSDATGFGVVDGGNLKAQRDMYAGMIKSRVEVDASNGAVITVRPGVFVAEPAKGERAQVTDKSGAVSIETTARRYLETLLAEVGDVDITKSDVLVSVGRGIEDQENLEMAFDLAKAMGADVSCSRPIVDAKWLEKSRQVGTSGQTVKPKVYLACGISGSFQHMGGVKGAPFIVAINKNPKAPIFQVADVGVAADILEFMPEMQEAIEAMG